jgi:hypothetical protein
MATDTLALVQNALEQYIREGQSTRQMNRAAVTLGLLRKEEHVGKNVAFDVRVGTGTGETYADGQDVTVFGNDTDRLATLPWGIYGNAFKVTALAESGAATSRTELARLFVSKLMDTADRVAAKINVDLHTGNGTSPQMHGFNATAGPLDATGVYAGIDRAVDTQWASNEEGTAGAITIADYEAMLDTIYVASGSVPDLITTTPALWRKTADLLRADGSARYNILDHSIELRGETIKLQGGANALFIDGVPIIKDKDVPTGVVNFYDTRHVLLKWMPPNDRIRAKDLALIPIAGTPEEQTGARGKTPLMMRVRALAEAGDYSATQGVVWTQLSCDRPNSCGVLTGRT